jgi:tRNA pseudouridine55 synthase
MMDTVLNSGFLLLNKPAGISSYGCIAVLKRIVKQKIKIGHAGTLDPFASGLLIIAFGRQATRKLSSFMAMEKSYVATGKLGQLTDTLDCTGQQIATSECVPSQEELQKALASFGQSYEQTPPIYSALKYEGSCLYTLARNKKIDVLQLQAIVEKKRRVVQLYDLQLLSYDFPYFTICARVSCGTYIRTLVNDIAVRAGSFATTIQLVRSSIGPFTISQAVELADIKSVEDINKSLFLDILI